MQSLKSLVFYTTVVLKIVILSVRLNSVLEASCYFRSRVKKIGKPETSKKQILQCFSISRWVFILKDGEFTV